VSAGPSMDDRALVAPAAAGPRALVALLVIIAATAAPGFLPALFATRLAAAASRSPADVGTLIGASLCAGCVGALLAGHAVSRWGAGIVLRTALPIAGGATALVAAVTAWPALVLAIAVLGAAVSGCGLAAASALTSTRPDQPRRLLCAQLVVTAGMGMTLPLIVGVVAGPAPDDAAAFRPLLAMCGVPLAAAALLVPTLPSRVPRPLEGPSSEAHPRPVELVVFALLIGLHAGADHALYQWGPTLLADAPGEPPFPTVWILSATSAVYLAVRLALMSMPDGWGARALAIAPGGIACALLMLALGYGGSFALTAVAIVGTAVCTGIQYPALVGALARRRPRHVPLILAIAALGSAVGATTLTWTVGVVAEASGLRIGLMVVPIALAGFSCLAWCLLAIISASRRRAAAVATAPIA